MASDSARGETGHGETGLSAIVQVITEGALHLLVRKAETYEWVPVLVD